MHLCAYDTMLLLHGHMFSGLGGGLKCPTLQFMMHTAVILSSLKYSSAQTIFSLCSRSFYSFPLPKEKILISVTAKRPHVPLKYFLFYLGDHVPCSRTDVPCGQNVSLTFPWTGPGYRSPSFYYFCSLCL